MKLLREDFFREDEQMRRSDLGEELAAMKTRLLEDLHTGRKGGQKSVLAEINPHDLTSPSKSLC